MHTRLLVLAAGLVIGLPAMAAYDFVSVPERRLGTRVGAIAIGDVNGDGLDDVVLASTFDFDIDNDHHVFVYLQQPDGSLAEPAKFAYAEFSGSVDLALGDLDNDGIRDIIVGAEGRLSLLIANDLGGFTGTSFSTPVSSVSTTVAVMDIDRDGDLDVIGQYASEGATLFFGDGNGGVASMSPLSTRAQGDNDLKIGDVTGDGRGDLVLASANASGFFVYPHDGIDGFGPEIAHPSPERFWSPATVAIGDFDGDGRNDVVAGIPANVPIAAVWLYSGLASGGLATPRRLDTFNAPRALVAADLDRDGRDDLVVGHSGWSAIGRYMQGASGLRQEVLTTAPFNEGSSALAEGDLNDDGCSDVAIADFGLVMLQGRNCIRLPARSDFDGDGRSDLLWHHATSGESSIWLGGEAGNRVHPTRVANPAWRIVGSGDFNGDGRSDIVWRNASTGANSIWASANSATPLPVTRVNNLAWSIVGIGDFDGDGRDDLLWRSADTGANAIWKSGDYLNQQAIAGVANPDWEVVAVDDFNDDGSDDILWRNRASGANSVWRSGNHQLHQPVTTLADPDWRVAGTGDFNGDGEADVLWRNRRHGSNALWHSAESQDPGIVTTVSNPDWNVVAVADYDGNGKPEIIWRNFRTGENRLWRSTHVVVERSVANVADPRWRVVR